MSSTRHLLAHKDDKDKEEDHTFGATSAKIKTLAGVLGRYIEESGEKGTKYGTRERESVCVGGIGGVCFERSRPTPPTNRTASVNHASRWSSTLHSVGEDIMPNVSLTPC